MIVCHGYLANLAFMEIPWAADLTQLGIAALFLDRRGHGRSGGDLWPRAPASHRLDDREPDVAAALAYLRAQPMLIDPERIGLLGHSDGATAALVAASADWDVRATVAVSASVAPWEYVNHAAPQNLLLIYGGDDRFVLQNTDRVLIARATRGSLTDAGQMGDVGAGAGRSLIRVPGRGHLDVLNSETARLRVLQWLRAAFRRESEHPGAAWAGPDVAVSPPLTPLRNGWLLTGAAALLVALAAPGLAQVAAPQAPLAPVRPPCAAVGTHMHRPETFGRCLAVSVLWILGLLPAPWLASHLRAVVPGQEGAVFAALLLGPAVSLAVGRECVRRIGLASERRASWDPATEVLSKLLKNTFGALRQACPEQRRRAQGERKSAMKSGRGSAHAEPVEARGGVFQSVRDAARGVVITAAIVTAAHLLFLHHYEVALTAKRAVLLLVFAVVALPAFALLEGALRWAWNNRPLPTTTCTLVIAGLTLLLSSLLFERMSMAPGCLIASGLVTGAAQRIGDGAGPHFCAAVVGGLTAASITAVGAALY